MRTNVRFTILVVTAIVGTVLAVGAPVGAVQLSGGDVLPAGTQYCAESYTSDRPVVTWDHNSWFGDAPVDYPVDINFPGDLGTPILAPADGTVEQVTVPPGGGFGNSVVWTSEDGSEQLHMAHLTVVTKTGEVTAGDQIGELGRSGDTLIAPNGEVDPHLHISRAVDGEPAPLYLSGIRIVPDIDAHTFDPSHPYGAWPCAITTYVSAGPAGTRWCDGRVATIVGTAGDDVLRGTDGPDVIAGLQGDDQIDGLDGDDVICGGQGDDTITGGQGFDILFGAQGNDVLWAAAETELTDVRGARLFGGAGNDEIHGSDRWDRMQGGAGDDLLHGYRGRDWLRGGSDADSLDGGAGIDDVGAAGGNDFIVVGDGDSVRGGTGRDSCLRVGRPALLWSCEQQTYPR